MRLRVPTMAVMTVITLALAGCTGEPGSPSAGRLGACADEPITCNTGERAAGGEAIWLIEQPWSNQWNPLRAEGASLYLRQALAGVAPEIGWFDPDGEWVWNLDLLSGAPELLNESPQTMRYEFRAEATWDDGTPIDLDDVLLQWFHNSGRPDHCADCSVGDSTGWAAVETIAGSDDDRVVTITLEEGAVDSEWYARFGPAPFPAHVAEQAGIDWRTPEGMQQASEYFRDTVPDWSGGPYLIESTLPDERVEMVPNPAWYGSVMPTLDRLVKEMVNTAADWPTALANRELHAGTPLSFSPDIVDQIAALEGVQSLVGPGGTSWEHVTINTTDESLADVELRRAILTALDTQDAAERIFGELPFTLRTNHLFPEASPFHVDALQESGLGSGDLDRAREILEAAGYAGFGDGEQLALDGTPIGPLEFAFLSGNETRANYVEIAQARLAAIGIEVIPTAVPGADFGGILFSGGFDLVIFSFDLGPLFASAAQLLFGSASQFNVSRHADERIDDLAGEVLNELDRQRAAELGNQVVQLVVEGAAILPLWDRPSFIFATDDLANVRDNINADLRSLYNDEAWGIRTG